MQHFMKYVLDGKPNFSTEKPKMEYCYSVYITTHEGNEVRTKSFMDKDDAAKYASHIRNLFNNGARVIREEKYW